MTDYTRLTDTGRIDFTSAHEVNATGHLLVALLQHYGGFQYPPARTLRLKLIQQESAAWLSNIRQYATQIAPHEVLQAITYYDILHRVTTGSPGTQFVNTQICRTFQAAADGDTRVDETELMQAIDKGRRMVQPLHTTGRHSAWFIATLRKWIPQMQAIDITGATSPDRELNRASIILAQPLTPNTAGLKEIQRKISSGYLRYCEDTHHADDRTLLAMLRFTGAALSADYERASTLRQHLIAALSASPTLHPAHRAAFSLDLAALTQAEAV